MNDNMPDKYKHPRHGLRTKLYTVMSKFSSELQIPKCQFEDAIVTTANILFGQEWKPCNKHQLPDLDRLPTMRNILEIEPFFEGMALNALVKERMKDDITATVYANDGSSRSGVGSYVVQSLTINGEQCALSTFSIFTELRESLAELQATTLKILSAASFHRYS